jgi:hypothetical protein
MQLSSPAAAKAVLRSCLWAVLLVLVAYMAFFGLAFPRVSQQARLVSCQHNLRLLQLVTISYAQDYDGHLPPRPTEGDWIARRWKAYPMRVRLRWRYKSVPTVAGPLEMYAKNAGIYGCPSDPDKGRDVPPRSSYDWNYALAGRLLEDVPGQPLAWDRAQFHRGGRNVVWTGTDETHPKWLAEDDFRALGLTQP